MKILVTDGNTLPGLAITRSLGKAGHEVIVGYQKKDCLAASSKYASSQCIYPDPAIQSGTFIDFLLDYVEYNNVDALFPVTDITTIPISKHKSDFEKYCKIPFGDFNIVDKAANKVGIMQLAQSLDIDIPESIIVNSYEELNTDDINFEYPLVIKPARSRILTETGWVYTTVTYANDKEDLKTQLSNYQKEIFPVLLQERIFGPGLGIFMCFSHGKPLAAFSHKRLREKPPSGGVSVLRQSVPLDPLALEFSEKLLSAIKWQGVAMVEFKVDQRDQRPKLMEINGRFWGSLQLAIDSGVNFPLLLAEAQENEHLEKVNKYKIGVKTRWLWGDIDALLIRLIKQSKNLQLPPNADSKLVYLLKFLKIWEPNLHYEVLRLNDIKPWFYESYQWLKHWFK